MYAHAARSLLVLALSLALVCSPIAVASNTAVSTPTAPVENNWAVIVGSSRYLFNYRHTSSALTVYHLLRHHGIDDDHILLFLADSYACDPRNLNPANMYSTTDAVRTNLYGCSAQVDYAGDDVDVRRLLNVLQGRYSESTPPTRRLLSDENSNIIIYISGHGAESYFKFQDSEFLSSTDISETFSMMHTQRRYKRIIFLADTCHAIALCEKIKAPNVVCLAASDAASESYSHAYDREQGIHLVSVWMYETLRMLEGSSCTDPAAGTTWKSPRSILHRSWHDFNYASDRRLEENYSPSIPAHRDAVNDPGAIKNWLVKDFMCGPPQKVISVPVQHDLL